MQSQKFKIPAKAPSLKYLISLLIVPYQGPQAIPMITILIDILHTAPQTRLYAFGIPPENPHDKAPARSRKYRPCVILNLVGNLSALNYACGRLNGHSCQCQYHSCEDVNHDLLVYGGDLAGAGRAATEDEVAAEEASDEGVIWS